MYLRRLMDQREGRRPHKRNRSDAVTNGNAKKVHVENNPELFRSVFKRPGKLIKSPVDRILSVAFVSVLTKI